MDAQKADAELPRSETGGAADVRPLSIVARPIWFWLVALALLLVALAVFKDIMLPFVVGMMLAYFLNPLTERVQALGLSRTAAAALIVGIVGTAFVVGVVLLAPILTTQVEHLAATLPGDIEKARKAIESIAHDRLGSHFGYVQAAIDRAVAELQANGSSLFASVASALWSRSAALINVLSLLLITPLVVFYLLVDWHPMLERVRLWLPRDNVTTIEHLASDINDAVAAFIRGQGAVCLFLGLFYAIALSLIGLNYGVLVGLATGLLAFVPMVGWVIGLAVATLIALVQFAPKFAPVLGVVGILVAGMALDTVLLSPKLVGKKVGLHPVWLIFALFAFSYLFGLVGTLVAVPVSAALAVLARFGIARYLDSDVYRGRSHRAVAEPLSRAQVRTPEPLP